MRLPYFIAPCGYCRDEWGEDSCADGVFLCLSCAGDGCEKCFGMGIELCPNCHGYAMVPQRMNFILMLSAKDFAPLFRTQKAAREFVANNYD